jgi:L-fuculose-phosphate aldolase
MGLCGADCVLYHTPTEWELPAACDSMPSERQYRKEIVRFGRMLHERGFVAATDGNLSVRLDHRRILVTPTSMSKGMMRPSDMVIVDMEGRRIRGRREVSSEIGMHLLIYRLRPDVRGIVHAHPPTATGFAACGVELNQPLVCEVVIGLGCIPLARYGTPGTPELTDALEPLVPQYDAILMSNHGVVTYGEDLSRAYMKMETVEHFARIALVARLLGHEQPLGAQEIEKLVMARSKYPAARSAAPMPLGVPNGAGNGGRGDHPRPRGEDAGSKESAPGRVSPTRR